MTNLIAKRGELKTACQIVNQQSNVNLCLDILVCMCGVLLLHML